MQLFVRLFRAETESVQDTGEAASGGISFCLFVGAFHPVVLAVQGFQILPCGMLHGLLHLPDPDLHVQQGLDDLCQLFPDSEGGIDVVVLVKVAHGAVLLQRNDARIGGELSRDHVQKRRLAGAVQAGDRCFVPLIQEKRSVPDDLFTRESFRYM